MEDLYRRAILLALITIFYNLAEGIVSVWLGLADETIALFGFGVDSFVEVISGIGVWHMLSRQRNTACQTTRDRFEGMALKVTGFSFYLLAAGLIAGSAVNILQGHHPETTFWGIVISTVSILSMWLLIRAKITVGRALQSDALLADANCTRTCLQLSVVLLVASIAYEVTGIGWVDSLGSLAIAWFSIREGREAFGKAAGKACCCNS